MAFNIMDLFGPSAVNRLLQPVQSAQGIPNMLLAPQAGFDPGRFGGGDRLPAVGMDALRERMAPPMQVAASGAAGAGAGPTASGSVAIDPWRGLREEDVVRLDQTQTAAAQPSAAAPAPAAAPRKPFFDDERMASLNDMFTGWAMGGTPQESIAYGAKMVAANRGTRKNVNETVKWLQSKGMDEGQAKMLASSPPALNEYLKSLAEGNDPMRALQIQKAQLEIQNLQNPQAKLTDDQREYQAAKDQGYTGSFMDYQIKMKEAGRTQVDINTGEKLPQGYRWKNPDDKTQGVEPIPGGPAEEIPSELAARIGMADSFLKQYEGIKGDIKAGKVTGPIDRFRAGSVGSSDQAKVYRQIQSGVDALMRMLTGAGMNETEARAYADRYLPSYTDDAASAVSKLDQLKAELESARSTALRGRGNIPSPAAPGQEDPLGIR